MVSFKKLFQTNGANGGGINSYSTSSSGRSNTLSGNMYSGKGGAGSRTLSNTHGRHASGQYGQPDLSRYDYHYRGTHEKGYRVYDEKNMSVDAQAAMYVSGLKVGDNGRTYSLREERGNRNRSNYSPNSNHSTPKNTRNGRYNSLTSNYKYGPSSISNTSSRTNSFANKRAPTTAAAKTRKRGTTNQQPRHVTNKRYSTNSAPRYYHQYTDKEEQGEQDEQDEGEDYNNYEHHDYDHHHKDMNDGRTRSITIKRIKNVNGVVQETTTTTTTRTLSLTSKHPQQRSSKKKKPQRTSTLTKLKRNEQQHPAYIENEFNQFSGGHEDHGESEFQDYQDYEEYHDYQNYQNFQDHEEYPEFEEYQENYENYENYPTTRPKNAYNTPTQSPKQKIARTRPSQRQQKKIQQSQKQVYPIVRKTTHAKEDFNAYTAGTYDGEEDEEEYYFGEDNIKNDGEMFYDADDSDLSPIKEDEHSSYVNELRSPRTTSHRTSRRAKTSGMSPVSPVSPVSAQGAWPNNRRRGNSQAGANVSVAAASAATAAATAAGSKGGITKNVYKPPTEETNLVKRKKSARKHKKSKEQELNGQQVDHYDQHDQYDQYDPSDQYDQYDQPDEQFTSENGYVSREKPAVTEAEMYAKALEIAKQRVYGPAGEPVIIPKKKYKHNLQMHMHSKPPVKTEKVETEVAVASNDGTVAVEEKSVKNEIDALENEKLAAAADVANGNPSGETERKTSNFENKTVELEQKIMQAEEKTKKKFKNLFRFSSRSRGSTVSKTTSNTSATGPTPTVAESPKTPVASVDNGVGEEDTSTNNHEHLLKHELSSNNLRGQATNDSESDSQHIDAPASNKHAYAEFTNSTTETHRVHSDPVTGELVNRGEIVHEYKPETEAPAEPYGVVGSALSKHSTLESKRDALTKGNGIAGKPAAVDEPLDSTKTENTSGLDEPHKSVLADESYVPRKSDDKESAELLHTQPAKKQVHTPIFKEEERDQHLGEASAEDTVPKHLHFDKETEENTANLETNEPVVISDHQIAYRKPKNIKHGSISSSKEDVEQHTFGEFFKANSHQKQVQGDLKKDEKNSFGDAKSFEVESSKTNPPVSAIPEQVPLLAQTTTTTVANQFIPAGSDGSAEFLPDNTVQESGNPQQQTQNIDSASWRDESGRSADVATSPSSFDHPDKFQPQKQPELPLDPTSHQNIEAPFEKNAPLPEATPVLQPPNNQALSSSDEQPALSGVAENGDKKIPKKKKKSSFFSKIVEFSQQNNGPQMKNNTNTKTNEPVLQTKQQLDETPGQSISQATSQTHNLVPPSNNRATDSSPSPPTAPKKKKKKLFRF